MLTVSEASIRVTQVRVAEKQHGGAVQPWSSLCILIRTFVPASAKRNRASSPLSIDVPSAPARASWQTGTF
jgi:hypothetical protein